MTKESTEKVILSIIGILIILAVITGILIFGVVSPAEKHCEETTNNCLDEYGCKLEVSEKYSFGKDNDLYRDQYMECLILEELNPRTSQKIECATIADGARYCYGIEEPKEAKS